MTNPNSLLTSIRRAIVKVVEPFPPEGEGWCLDCSLNGGKTAAYLRESLINHVRSHPKGDYVKVNVSFKEKKK